MNTLEPDIAFGVNERDDGISLIIRIYDNRVTKPDSPSFIVFDDRELEKGLYNNTIILDPKSINRLLQNYKTTFDVWEEFAVGFVPDLVSVRNLYLCCSELSSFSSLTNFTWNGSNIIKKIPINVPFGSMLYHFQQTPHDYFICSNRTLTKLRFQLKNSMGDVISLDNHYSFTIIFVKGEP
jgi:hypothetical protein